MPRSAKDSTVRVKGLGLLGSFVMPMTLSLALVMAAGGVVLYQSATRVAEKIHEDAIYRGLRLTAMEDNYEQSEKEMHVSTVVPGGASVAVVYGPGTAGSEGSGAAESGARKSSSRMAGSGTLYEWKERDVEKGEEPRSRRLLVPGDIGEVGTQLLGLIVAFAILTVLVGAAVAAWVASRVTSPIQDIIQDVRQIARGDLKHRTRVRGPGEVEVLARALDRMSVDLEDAQESEIELSVREREMELAGEVREALLPLSTPELPGYDIASAHLSSLRSGGDFYEFIERDDGRMGLLVCDVSGQGVPAALVGATARAYLRTGLSDEADVEEVLGGINRFLRNDVRRGMFVTALFCSIDVERQTASIACAGHKVPLVRYSAADKKLRLVHPEGIALGLDPGPVFERTLKLQEIPLEPGDRLLLCNSGPLRVASEGGEELGEKRFFRSVLRHAEKDSIAFVRGIRKDLETFAGGKDFPADIALITLSRDA